MPPRLTADEARAKAQSGPAMDLANMRDMGVRGLMVACRSCHVARVVSVDAYDGSLTVPSFGPRMGGGGRACNRAKFRYGNAGNFIQSATLACP